jgi:hypothetical protein
MPIDPEDVPVDVPENALCVPVAPVGPGLPLRLRLPVGEAVGKLIVSLIWKKLSLAASSSVARTEVVVVLQTMEESVEVVVRNSTYVSQYV